LPIAPPKVEFAENPAARLAPPVATDEDDDLTVVGGVLALPVAGSRAAGADATVTAVPQSSPPTAKVPVGVGGSGTRVADGGLFDQGADPGVVDDPPTVVAPPAAPDGPRPPRAHRGPWIFAIVAIVVVLLAGSGAVVYRFVLYGHHVPGLTGLSTTGARKAVNRSGLVLKIGGSTYSATIPVGEILTQTPASGTALRSGATVTVTLSLGVKPVTVPSVVGQGRKAAVNALVAGNLKPVVTTANSETVPRGRVISETPSSGTEAPGTAIALQISLGPAPRTIPQFANATYAAAAASLQALRLVPSEQQAYSTTVASGDVISTTPAEGATGVRVGTTVVVTVSKGPQMVAIPPVAGTSVTAAVAALRAAGLVVAEVIGPPFATMAVTTNPAPGTPVQVGSSVTLYAATG
jgi:serine/threonine-protein kinase